MLNSWSSNGKIAAFVPVDISAEFLEIAATELKQEFPNIEILWQVADISKDFMLELPKHLMAKRQ